MNAMDIITGLNGIRDSYVVSAGEFRQGTRRAGRLSGRRLWLIAAIVALTLLLVGCAALYVLRLQNMVVGKYTFSIPTEYDENGEVIPVESREPVTLLSVQGTNMDALREWVAFTNAYDPDGTIMLEADLAAKSGAPSSIPENYEYTYGCYSQEMVDKLNALVEAYHLKLLSRYIPFNVWENSVLFRSLGLGSLVYDDPRVQVKYWDGSFHPEGTFGLTMDIHADMGDWELRQEFAGYHYSMKDYFDPSTDSMLESRDYTQWDYTRRDGQRVLLVLSEGTARIYAEKPEAFLSIYLDPVICVDGEEVPMTQTALQQLAELFDLSVSPTPATAEQIAQYRAQALAEHEATRAQARAEHEAMYAVGYREYVDYLLETAPNPEIMSYALYDVNGDGVEELVIAGRDILSVKDGQSYRYFDLTGTGIIFPSFRPCEGNRFEIYCEVLGMNQHFFYQANAESAVFLTGVSCDDPGAHGICIKAMAAPPRTGSRSRSRRRRRSWMPSPGSIFTGAP